MRLFVGLDVSSFDIKACILNGEGKKLDSFSVTTTCQVPQRSKSECYSV
ncbi:transposase (plasmid) [Bacillus thuringiensis serovar kurstaki str. YBT-1520]|nr:transposase [Bacillus thuringiensis serovar kurstaki str. YBT-1520]